MSDARTQNLDSARDQIDLVELFHDVWNRKWFAIGLVTTFIALSVIYVMMTTKWYRSDVLLAPAADQSAPGLQGGFGGLAGLAGLNIGLSNNDEPIAVLKSRDFARSFIQDYQLLTILLVDKWDADNKTWKEKDLSEQPDIRDAVKYFDEKVLSVSANAKTDLVTLRIEWTDPKIAAEWASILVVRLNDRMRERALADAERNVAYLKGEIAKTNIASLRQSISNILETELQKLMLAKGNSEFSFRIIDGAQVPRKHVKPMGLLVVAGATVLGAMIAFFTIFLGHAANRRRHSNSNE